MKKKNKAVSAIVGVILMVSITVVVAFATYIYVEQQRKPEEIDISIAKTMNWTKYNDECYEFDADWDNITIEHDEDSWYCFPASLKSKCSQPDKNITACLNIDTYETIIKVR